MLFNTISYLVFLGIVVPVFWLLSPIGRRWLVLGASILFYALWRVEFVFLIAFSALVDFYFSLRIYAEARPERRRLWLICSLAINLGLLAYFKYAYFLVGNAEGLGKLFGFDWSLNVGNIVLPLGISFYTFLSISYTLDVYRGFFTPVRNFSTYLSYVMFWPHMIAGPILRAHELIPQLRGFAKFDVERMTEGVRSILFGLFLKVALADQLAPMVDDAFLASPSQLSALDVWTMGFGFGLQIYFDFAGYSMIAIGSALLMGVRFPDNFNWPYLSSSPREFWKRWHITLSSWIRDYLYLPLIGAQYRDDSRGGIEIKGAIGKPVRATIALFVTWFLMGLWHGANWTFAIWGIWHATFIWLYRLIVPRLTFVPSTIQSIGGWLLTVAVVMLAWIPFRAKTVGDALMLWSRILDPRAYTFLSFRENFYLLVALMFTGMIVLFFAEKALLQERLVILRQIAEVAIVASCAFVVFIFLRPTGQFIYFQF